MTGGPAFANSATMFAARALMSTPNSTLVPGATLQGGRYTILGELARGGMGVVHLARERGSPALLVLKHLSVEHGDDVDLVRRLEREARLTARLSHPGIARLVDAVEEGGLLHLLFEHVAGQSLAKVLGRLAAGRQWVAPSAAVRVVLEVLDALAHAHAATDPQGEPLGLVHRDLSPSNVMLGYEGGVKVIDFGAAAGRVGDHQTLPGRVLGTVRYMSPEQALSRAVDRRSDLYTVGVLLWELLSGRRMVAKGTLQTMLVAVVRQPAPPLSSLMRELPPALSAVVERALAKDPDARWPDAVSMRDALLRAAEPLGIVEPDALGTLVSALFSTERREAEARAARSEELAMAELAHVDPTQPTPSPPLPRGAPSRTRTWPDDADRVDPQPLDERDLARMTINRRAGEEPSWAEPERDFAPGELTSRELAAPTLIDGARTSVATDSGETRVTVASGPATTATPMPDWELAGTRATPFPGGEPDTRLGPVGRSAEASAKPLPKGRVRLRTLLGSMALVALGMLLAIVGQRLLATPTVESQGPVGERVPIATAKPPGQGPRIEPRRGPGVGSNGAGAEASRVDAVAVEESASARAQAPTERPRRAVVDVSAQREPPAPPPPRAEEAMLASIAAKLERLEDAPDDPRLLTELHDELIEAAATLSEQERRSVEAVTRTSLRGGGAAALRQAFERLRRALR